MIEEAATANNSSLGWSPGLVVMGGDLRSRGCAFQIPAPDTGWTFFTLYCCKNRVDVCLERPKNK